MTVYQLFDETTVVRNGQEGMPSVRAIAITGQTMGLGMTVIGNFEAVRLPHPKPVIEAVLRLARTWDDTLARVQNLRAGVDDVVEEVETRIEACEGGHVTIVFSTPVDALMLDPDSADAIAHDLRAAARAVREGGVDAGGEEG